MAPFHRLIGARKRIFVFFVVLLSLVLAASVIPTQAQASAVPSCAITPSLLGGQGFTLSGQGFTLSGQGFTLSGQGFTLSGQGFTLSGQGLDPVAVANEVRNNPITIGKWVDDRLGFFLDRLGFNTNSTAILVIDEFNTPDAHGFEVRQVVDDAINSLKETVSDLKMEAFNIDISDVNTNYDASKIAAKIATKVDELKPTYHHFVLNMSFGLIACNDTGTSTTPGFDFTQAMHVVEANNQATPSLGITPVLECVVKKYGGHDDDLKSSTSTFGGEHDDSGYIAYFGYRNENSKLVSIPIGASNNFGGSYWSQDKGQPTFFEPGQQHFVFAVPFGSHGITWSLKGPDGTMRTVTAAANSTPCPNTPPLPLQQITPTVDCVANLGDGVYEAHFGYNNPNSLGSRISVGIYNKFTPGDRNRGQVTTFVPGVHKDVFKVTFNGADLSWWLTGVKVTANASSPGCAEQEGYGFSQYLTQNLGVPESQLPNYWANLANKAAQDNSLNGLRALLHKYLQDSSDPYLNFTAVTVASSGNLRPWLGAAPLAPASWPETIAVGASLDDSNTPWSFSQDANVLAPGAGYPFSANNYGAGTSFSAPAFSVLVGMCSTVPSALKFDGAAPPLVPPTVDNSGNKILTNSPIGLDDLSPFNCKPNRPPTIDSIANRSDVVGSSVLLQATANDPDGDQLTFSATGLPPGISIDSQGKISGIIGGAAHTYTVTVTVKDNGTPQGEDSTTFTWDVTAPAGPLHVNIDIKPFSPTNRINLRSYGKVLVAILGSATFDASTVNPSTITLAGAPVAMNRWLPDTYLFDINHDHYRDLLFRVKVQDLQLTATSTTATMNAQTYSGQAIEGSDAVKIVPPHAPNNKWPKVGTTINGRTVTLNWEPVDEEDDAQTCYQVVIANNTNFTNPTQTGTVIQLGSYTSYQLNNGAYYWHVAVSDCAGNAISPWSETWGFSIRGR